MATQASDRALTSVEKATIHFEDLLVEWNERKDDNRVKRMVERKQPNPPGPKTVVLLRLFWER